jgi:hypothetical protein
MAPVEETVSPRFGVVVVYVTAPSLAATVIGGGTNVAESGVVVDPEVAEVWIRVWPPEGDPPDGGPAVEVTVKV